MLERKALKTATPSSDVRLRSKRNSRYKNSSAPPEQITRTLLDAFRDIVGATADTATAHRWRYAEPAPSSVAAPGRFAWRAGPRIGLCGDWLGGGKIEGAWLSGTGLGGAVADTLITH